MRVFHSFFSCCQMSPENEKKWFHKTNMAKTHIEFLIVFFPPSVWCVWLAFSLKFLHFVCMAKLNNPSSTLFPQIQEKPRESVSTSDLIRFQIQFDTKKTLKNCIFIKSLWSLQKKTLSKEKIKFQSLSCKSVTLKKAEYKTFSYKTKNVLKKSSFLA